MSPTIQELGIDRLSLEDRLAIADEIYGSVNREATEPLRPDSRQPKQSLLSKPMWVFVAGSAVAILPIVAYRDWILREFQDSGVYALPFLMVWSAIMLVPLIAIHSKAGRTLERGLSLFAIFAALGGTYLGIHQWGQSDRSPMAFALCAKWMLLGMILAVASICLMCLVRTPKSGKTDRHGWERTVTGVILMACIASGALVVENLDWIPKQAVNQRR
jgi:hypothetical protein